MRRQRNTQQTKEQGKNPADLTNEEEIGSLPEKEFRIMIVKMIQNLGNRREKIQETFNKDLEELKSKQTGASLVAQCLRICLPMQGRWVQALVREDPTCHGATKPVRHNYGACNLEPASHNYWARVPQLLKPERLEPVLCNKRSHCSEKPAHHNKE